MGDRKVVITHRERDTKVDHDDSGARPLKRNAMFMRGKVTITRS